MAHTSFRKSQLIAFNNVAAGHDGVLSDPSGSVIVKPCKKEEILFYQSTLSHPEFAAYIPTFIGTLALSSDPSGALPPATVIAPNATNHQTLGPQVVDAVAVERAWAPSNGGKITTDSAIVMENVAADFKKPNILDVKLGARLWADDAPAAKRERLDKAAAETTSRSLGLRIAGMRIWEGSDAIGQIGVALDGYKFYDKNYGKKFTPDNVGQGFEEYFCFMRARASNRSIRKVIRRFIADLKGMQGVLEREESRMYSASLLFVYEGDDLALEAAFQKEKDIMASLDHGLTAAQVPTNGEGVAFHENGVCLSNGAAPDDEALPLHQSPASNTTAETEDEDDDDEEPSYPSIQALKLIDFAHAEWTPGKGPDENLLHGIRNVIRILDDIQRCIEI